ncbi:response regulator transcription factor [Pseudarthrobacter sp. B907]|uniref:response regulator transcription factor n=1 Tax=Pseudarthrobacter sp. B907 TaxID=3158261 RepID=UPI0032DB364A
MADPKPRGPDAAKGGGVYVLDDHEVVRRGLRQVIESAGLVVAGESGSAREASRRIPALRPVMAVLDDDLPDGSGVDVCRAVALADHSIRCVLMTGEDDESVLIDSVLAGAWGCLSKQDDSGEQLRLIRRVLTGQTAYSSRFLPGLAGRASGQRGDDGPEELLLRLSNRETSVALALARGLSNRQIGRELFLAEKTVKNMVSSILDKLGMARRTEVAVLVTGALNRPEVSAGAGYRSCRSPDLVAEVTAALADCTSDGRSGPWTDAGLVAAAARLANALDATRMESTGHSSVMNRHSGSRPGSGGVLPTR